MDGTSFDNVIGSLGRLLEQRDRFEAKFGPAAVPFLDHLPALYRFHHRLAFDLALEPGLRFRSAAVALYIAEPHDYFGESTAGVEGLIDDLWLGFEGLRRLLETVPEELLQRHWQSERPFAEAAALAVKVASLEASVPSRVQAQLRKFLG